MHASHVLAGLTAVILTGGVGFGTDEWHQSTFDYDVAEFP